MGFREGKGLGRGINILRFCPWGKTDFELEPNLKSWVLNWVGMKAEILTPSDWYIRLHDLNGGYYNRDDFWIYN